MANKSAATVAHDEKIETARKFLQDLILGRRLTVYAAVKYTSSRGQKRIISLYIIKEGCRDTLTPSKLIDITWAACLVCHETLDPKYGGMPVVSSGLSATNAAVRDLERSLDLPFGSLVLQDI